MLHHSLQARVRPDCLLKAAALILLIDINLLVSNYSLCGRQKGQTGQLTVSETDFTVVIYVLSSSLETIIKTITNLVQRLNQPKL